MDARAVTVGTSGEVLTHARQSQGDGTYMVRNLDDTEWVYFGGNDVDTSNGFPIKPDEAFAFSLHLGESAYLIASADDVPVVIVEGNR